MHKEELKMEFAKAFARRHFLFQQHYFEGMSKEELAQTELGRGEANMAIGLALNEICGYWNRYMLEDRQHMSELIRQFPNIRMVKGPQFESIIHVYPEQARRLYDIAYMSMLTSRIKQEMRGRSPLEWESLIAFHGFRMMDEDNVANLYVAMLHQDKAEDSKAILEQLASI